MEKEIYLYSTMTNGVAESLISQLEDYKNENVVLRTNCTGGDIIAGYGICAKIAEHGQVRMKVDGSVDSMAVNLMLYAKSVECLDVSSFTLGKAAYPTWMTPTSEEKAYINNINSLLKSKMLQKINPDTFNSVTGYSINEMFDPNKSISIEINAEQAKKIGLVQKVNKLTPSEIEAMNKQQVYASNENNKTVINMRAEEIKSKYPEAYNEIYTLGIIEGKSVDKVLSQKQKAYMFKETIKAEVRNVSQSDIAEFQAAVNLRIEASKNSTVFNFS